MLFSRIRFSVILVVIATISQVRADYFDTGFITLHQDMPYTNVAFSARHWGDAFASSYRTSDDYTIVKVFDQGRTYFYYATLDQDGEFASNGKLVGVDSPTQESYKLERSAERSDFLDSLRQVAFAGADAVADSTRARVIGSSLDEPVVEQIGLLLVQFSNTNYQARYVQNGSIDWPVEPFAIVNDQFNSVEQTFEHPNIIGTPGEEIVCGSFKDYWLESSHYTIETVGTIINPWVQDGNPSNDQWIVLNNTCEYYSDRRGDLCRDAMQTAINLGWMDAEDWDNDDPTRQIIVLNLGAYPEDPQNICAVGGPAYVSGVRVQQDEQNYWIRTTPINMIGASHFGSDDPDWMHIGLATHEWGHLIGFAYYGPEGGGNLECGMHGVMANGWHTGARMRGECPARLRAPDLIRLGIADWLESVGRGGIIDITSDMTNVTIPAPTPLTHTIARREVGGQTFLIEAIDYERQRYTWDSYIAIDGHAVNSPPIQDCNLMVWRYDGVSVSNVRLIEMGVATGDSWNYYIEWQGSTSDQLPGRDGRNMFCPFPVSIANDPDATPTSRIGTGNPPTTHSNFAILNIRGTDYPADAQVTANFRVNWPWSITGIDTLYAPFELRQDITIGSGATLTILPGPNGLAENNVVCMLDNEIFVSAGGKLVVKGSASDPITFLCNGNDTWDGIRIQSGSVNLDYVNIYDAKTYCVYTSSPSGGTPPVSLTNSYFDGGSIVSGGNALRLWGSPGYTQKVENCVVDNVPIGSGLYLYNCLVDFDDVSVTGCDYVNSYLKTVSGSFRRCTFEGRTSNYGVLCIAATCNPNFMCCEFVDLAPTSGSFQTTFFSATGCAPTFGGYGYADGVSNVFEDESDYLMVIQGTGLLPKINSSGITIPRLGGKNDWYQNSGSGKFIEWRDAPAIPVSAFDARSQFWSPAASTTMFTPSSTTYFNFTLPHAAYGLCGGAEGGGGSSIPFDPMARGRTLDEDDDQEILAYAQYLASIDSSSAALEIFSDLSEFAESLDVRFAAVAGLVTTSCRVEGDHSWIVSTIDDVMAADTSYTTRVLCGRLRGNYYLKAGQFDDAISVFTGLLYSGLTLTDSVYVATELFGVQLLAGIGNSGGPLDDMVLDRLPKSLRINSIEDGLRKEQELFNLLGGHESTDETAITIPTEYLLYQNYPNPFNPTTQIEFDLPEAVRVTLKVFNTLGQEVATVNDAMYPAGHHVATWNGKSNAGADVATGLYVYQIQAGSFTDTKKMVLMR